MPHVHPQRAVVSQYARKPREAAPFGFDSLESAIVDPLGFFSSVASPKKQHVSTVTVKPTSTSIATVFYTAAPTFDGPIAGYTTSGLSASSQKSSTKLTTSQTPTLKSTAVAIVSDTSKLTTSTSATSASALAFTASTMSYKTPTGTYSATKTSAADSTQSSSAVTKTSMTSGAKAGLVLGLLLLFILLLVGLLLFFKHKKRQREQEAESEKSTAYNAAASSPYGAASRNNATPDSPNAPRLSLRPVTQFFPGWTGAGRNSAAGQRGPESPVGRKPIPTAGQQYNISRPSTANDPNNPFGNHAAASSPTIPSINVTSPEQYGGPQNGSSYNPQAPSDVPMKALPSPSPPQQTSPTFEDSHAPGVSAPTPAVLAAAGAGVAGGLAASAIAARRSSRDPMSEALKQEFKQAPADSNEAQYSPNSPTSDGNKSPTGSPPAGAAVPASGTMTTPVPAAKPVHRVQQDYLPAMPDELELRAGQLVRVLHEFDDGWVS
jgi:hypothetical protein